MYHFVSTFILCFQRTSLADHQNSDNNWLFSLSLARLWLRKASSAFYMTTLDVWSGELPTHQVLRVQCQECASLYHHLIKKQQTQLKGWRDSLTVPLPSGRRSSSVWGRTWSLLQSRWSKVGTSLRYSSLSVILCSQILSAFPPHSLFFFVLLCCSAFFLFLPNRKTRNVD